MCVCVCVLCVTHIPTDMVKGCVGDVALLGITESFQVKRQVLLSAAEAAEMILRVDNLLKAAPRSAEHWGLSNFHILKLKLHCVIVCRFFRGFEGGAFLPPPPPRKWSCPPEL